MDLKIKTIGHNRIYELENIVRELFFYSNIVFDGECENVVESHLLKNSVHTVIRLFGKEYTGIYTENKYKPYLNKLGIMTVLSFQDAYKKYKDFSLPWGILIGIRPQKKVTDFRNLGFDDDKIGEILENDFLISPQKIDLMIKAADYEEMLQQAVQKTGYSVYIGVPFCPSRCSYCSFISKTYKDSSITGKYVDCLIREIEAYTPFQSPDSIYIGGGTPTILSSGDLDRLLQTINKVFHPKKTEFTVEAGRPDTITKEKLFTLKSNNVSRISINPQTLNEKTLKAIGRNHTADDFFKAYDLARCMGFNTVNTDVIAGLPGESVSDFEKTINGILRLKPENITVHTLSYKRAAKINKEERRSFANEMQNCAKELLKEYNPYYLYRQKNTLDNLENVGYTLPGHECRYNMYMMNETENIISFGGGAVSKIIGENSITRIRNPKDGDEYIKEIDRLIKEKGDVIFEGPYNK